MSELIIRQASANDATLILGFIRELAVYEKAEHEVHASEQDISNTLFAADAIARAIICEKSGSAIGYAVYFFNYSTWLGKNGIYLEDLYITPAARRGGGGKAMLKYLARLALKNSCGRFEWSVLNWNEPAIKFYESLGAKPLDEWVGYRLTGQPLIDLAKS